MRQNRCGCQYCVKKVLWQRAKGMVYWGMVQAVSADAVRRFIANVASEDITYHEYEDAYHVLMFCPERHHVVDQMVSWLLARANQTTHSSLVSPKLHMVHRNGTFKRVKGGKWGVSSQELIQRPSRSTSNVAEMVVS